MDMPTYDGLIERWKIELITTRARRMGFRRHEMPDALQEVVIELLNFDYDPEHVAGARESTVLITVIDRRLRKLKRSAARYNAHVERLAEQTTERHDAIDLRAMDTADAIARLSDRERAVCRGLANGLAKSRIAEELGCGWHTVNRIVERLRSRFDGLGPLGREGK